MAEVKAQPLRTWFAANVALWLPVLLGMGGAALTAHLFGGVVDERLSAPPYGSLAADPLLGQAFRMVIWITATFIGVAATWLTGRLLSATPEQHRTGSGLVLLFGVYQFLPALVRLALVLT